MAANTRRVDREGIDTVLLIMAFILGVGLAVGLKIMMFPAWVPALASAAVIVGYAVVTYASSAARLEPEQIGDNCYYLGFCITLASLAYTLYGLSSAGSDAALLNDVIAGFGVALSSTVVGVMTRVVLLQFRVDLAARDKEARSELNQVMRAFHGEMRSAVSSTMETSTQIRQSLKEHADHMIEANTRMQESFEVRIEALVDDAVSNVKSAMGEVVESGKDMNRRIAASSRANTTSAEKAIVASMETVVGDLKRAAEAFEAGMGQANERSVKSLEKMISEISAAMMLLSKETRKSIQEARDLQSTETTKAIEAVAANIFELAGELGRQKDKIGEALDGYTRETANACQTIARIARDSASAQAEAYKSAESITGASRTLADTATRIEKAVSEIPKAATDAPGALVARMPTARPQTHLGSLSGTSALKSGIAAPGATSSGSTLISTPDAGSQGGEKKQRGEYIWGKFSLGGASDK